MKDSDEISSFHGIQFDRRNDVIKMSQSMYLKNIFKKFDIENCKPRATACELYYKDEANKKRSSTRRDHQQEEILKNGGTFTLFDNLHSTRFDLCCDKIATTFIYTRQTQSDWVLLKHVFQYIKDTVNYCLTFLKSDLNLSTYCDAEWASSLENRHCISDYCFMPFRHAKLSIWHYLLHVKKLHI